MAFSLYCLINENSESFSLEFFEEGLRKCFSKTKGLSLTYDEDPFDPSNKHLLLSWESWWIKFFYETGQHVIDDSLEIATHAKTSLAREISRACPQFILQ